MWAALLPTSRKTKIMLTSLRSLFRPKAKSQQLIANSQVTDSPGWTSLTSRLHDYDPAHVQDIYQDALTAWRIIAITTDYIVGDTFTISSSVQSLNKFIGLFWHHPKNTMDLRLETMCDELSRSGDLFVLLFRNDMDGMSYIRFVTKDQITKIDTAPNDWETELSYAEISPWACPILGRDRKSHQPMIISPTEFETNTAGTAS